jgi:glycolate oxidase
VVGFWLDGLAPVAIDAVEIREEKGCIEQPELTGFVTNRDPSMAIPGWEVRRHCRCHLLAILALQRPEDLVEQHTEVRLAGTLDSVDQLKNELEDLLSPEQVRSDQVELGLFRADASTFDLGAAGLVCLPHNTGDVQAIVKACVRHGRAFVARGGGTGLAGGAIPCGDRPVVIALSGLDQILEVDVQARLAWVEPGVINLDLTKHLSPFGFHFAPDPSSQMASTLGGNLANNSGGPHCLAYGITNAHVLAIELVLPDGQIGVIGSVEGDAPGYDLRGVVVGSEGMLGIATRIAVKITPNPPAIATLLAAFATVTEAAQAVTAVIGDGLIPAAIELMDRNAIKLIEDFVHAGYPRDAEAVILLELDGLRAGVEAMAARTSQILTAAGAISVRTAADDVERALLWKGRKAAFGAISQAQPDYYLNDTVVPRRRLVEVLESIYEIAARYDLMVINVFHAGDGNLHPILAFDSREPGRLEQVHKAGREIVEASMAAGGVLSGEHGIGVEKQAYMSLMFSPIDLAQQDLLRTTFDPDGLSNPGKVLPTGATCAELQHMHTVPEGIWA